MVNRNYYIRGLIDEAIEILSKMSINYNTKAGNNIHALIEIVEELMPLVENEYPAIYQILHSVATNIIRRENNGINAYSFGDLRTSIHTLDMLYPSSERKIFISHSSKDEKIIKQFTKDILIAGCGLRQNGIFCTLDHSSIHTGEDFRNEIVNGMKESDFILLMISNNYKESEVCLNEMGAAWALTGKTVLPFVLPDCAFEDMGFLYKVKQGASIIDKTKLDELYKDICETYDLEQDWIHFNQISNEFIEFVKQQKPIGEKEIKAKDTSNILLDSLSEFDKKHLLEWTLVDDGECWIIESMDGTFVQLGTADYDISSGREKAKWDTFFERMAELGFAVIDRLNSDGSPIYKLKQAAYDYADMLRE